MRRLFIVVSCFGSAMIGTADLANAGLLFATQYDFDGRLISIETNTGLGTVVGALDDTTALAVGLGNRDGRLFTKKAAFGGTLLELDPNSGSTIQTFDLGISAPTDGGLSFRSDGIGFLSTSGGGAGFGGRLWSFDITGPSSIEINSNQLPGIDALAFDSSDVLFGLSSDDQGLYTINQTTGAVTLVGNTGLSLDRSGNSGLAFASDGTLFGVFDAAANGESSLFRIDKTTGAATLIGATGFANLGGLTNGPVQAVVPEPSSLVLLGIGAFGLFGYRLRRQPKQVVS